MKKRVMTKRNKKVEDESCAEETQIPVSAAPAQAKERVRIEVDGVTVEGKIVVGEPRDLCVRILRPYRGLVDAIHLPHFDTVTPSFSGQVKVDRAKALLKKCYDFGLKLEQRLDQVRPAYFQMKEQTDVLKAELASLKKRKRQREDSMASMLSSVKESALKMKLWQLEEEFAKNGLKDIGIHMFLNDKVVFAVLEGKRSLRAGGSL